MSDTFDVGERLKILRLHSKLSQRQLAQSAGVPHGQISMIETNRSSPSVASLRKILGGMQMTMSEFFDSENHPSDAIFFTSSELLDLTSRLSKTNPGAIKLQQVGDARSHGLQILQETYQPGADTGETMLSHQASEGGIVVSGEIEVTVADTRRILKAGDSYLFDSRSPHRFRNISDAPAHVISACTPPYL